MDAISPAKQLKPSNRLQPSQASKRLKVTSILKRYRAAAGLNDPLFPSRDLTPAVDISPLPSDELTRVLNLLTACRSGKLGSHVFHCDGCQRSLVGLNRCTNRHCPACSHGRRQAWQASVSQWTPRCSYWHIVFTLPHELNPLLRANEAVLFRLFGTCCSHVLLRVATRELDCQPGMISTLHTWGQRMNYHVHQHTIVTAGGLSLDEQTWVELSLEHPALRAQALADQLRITFLRRLRSRLKRGQLLWPAEEIDISQEEFFERLGRKSWVADCKATSPELQSATRDNSDSNASQEATGAEGIVHYLAAYVSGTAIGNGRILEDNGQTVHFQYKDYRTGTLEVEKLSGVEFTRRFCQHVWPKSIRKVRYGGLFAARGRTQRLARCNEFILQAQAVTPDQVSAGHNQAASQFSEDATDELEASPTMSGVCCRNCQGPLVVSARLKGLPTQQLMSLVAAIFSLLPSLSEQIIAALQANLPCPPQQLKQLASDGCFPKSITAALFGTTLDYDHCQALFAFIDWQRERSRSSPGNHFKPP